MFFPLKISRSFNNPVQEASITIGMWISYQTTWKLETLISKALGLEVFGIKTNLTNKGGSGQCDKTEGGGKSCV